MTTLFIREMVEFIIITILIGNPCALAKTIRLIMVRYWHIFTGIITNRTGVSGMVVKNI